MCLAIHEYYNFTTELTNCLFVKMDVAALQVSSVQIQNEICTIAFVLAIVYESKCFSQSNYDLPTCILQYLRPLEQR